MANDGRPGWGMGLGHNTGMRREIRAYGLPTVREGCTRWMVAQSGVGSVQLCSCGHVHVMIAGLTLRLPGDALVDLHKLLTAALERVRDTPVEEFNVPMSGTEH